LAKNIHERTKTITRQCPQNPVQVQRSKTSVREETKRLWRKGLVKHMSDMSGLKGRGFKMFIL